MRKTLIGAAAVPLLVVPYFFFIPQWARWFVGGAMVATSVALVVFIIVLGSGTAPRIMGAWGEEWTARELKSLGRRGWAVLHRSILTFDDIDHIAIGPAGVIVVETKWRGEAWTSDDRDGRIAAAKAQVTRNARRVRGYLKKVVRSAPVYPIVVLWSPEACDLRVEAPRDGEAQVLSGRDLRGWLEALGSVVLGPEEIRSAAALIAGQTLKRDDYELAKFGPLPKTPYGYWLDFVGVILGLLAGPLVIMVLVRHTTSSLVMVLGSWILTAIGWPLRSSRSTHLFASAWVLGAGALSLVLTIFVVMGTILS
jgi:hypothetical protein